jgi:hypothetical protein
LRDLGAAFDACCNVLIFKFNGESRVDSPANSPIFKILFGQCRARHFSCVSILVRLPSVSTISRKCARLRQAFLGAFQAPDFESVGDHLQFPGLKSRSLLGAWNGPLVHMLRLSGWRPASNQLFSTETCPKITFHTLILTALRSRGLTPR